MQELSVYQQVIASQQHAYVEESFLTVLDRVCVSMGCVIEDLTSEVAQMPPFQEQSVRIISEVDIYNIPVLLDVLRAHPYRFTLDGIEVHAITQPVKVQFRLSRKLLPKDISEPEWVTRLGWTEEELVRIRALYGSWLTNRWAEQLNEEHRSASVDWSTLYGTLSRDLWKVHRQKGVLVYTPDRGIVLRFDQ